MKRWWWVLPSVAVGLWWAIGGWDTGKTNPSSQGFSGEVRVGDGVIAEPNVAQSPKESVVQLRASESSQVVVSSAPDELSMLSDVPRSEYKSPPPGMVEFRVTEKDLVVGFGDIVLGRLPEGTKVPKGITPAPKNRLWPSARVPYQIQSGLSPQTVTAIQEAVAYFRDHSPVHFEQATADDKDLIVFLPAEKLCGSYLGRMGGAQPIYVSVDCGRQEVIHELMHALGFVHEQSREDRDQFVEIVWSAIDPEFWSQFGIVPEDWVHEYRGSVFDFDYESAMLYGPKSFVRSPDLVSLKSRGFRELKPTEMGLSRRDLERLFYLYGR